MVEQEKIRVKDKDTGLRTEVDFPWGEEGHLACRSGSESSVSRCSGF